MCHDHWLWRQWKDFFDWYKLKKYWKKMDQPLFTIKNIQTLAERLKMKNSMSLQLFLIYFCLRRKLSQPYPTKWISFTFYINRVSWQNSSYLQSWTMGCRQIHEIKQNRFSMECLIADFLQLFYRKAAKFVFNVGKWVLAIKSKHCRDFLEILWFPKILVLSCSATRTLNFWW